MALPLAFKKVEAIPLSKTPERMLIRWSLVPSSADLSDYEFYIDRGNAPEQSLTAFNKTIDGSPLTPQMALSVTSNLEQISGAISALDFYEYVDSLASFWDFYKVQFYRIRCRRISTQEELHSELFTAEGDLDPVGLYIIDENNWLLEDSTGEPSFVYRRRSSGVLCDCVDPVQKKRLVSQCTKCFGTNWDGGFYDPLTTFVDYSPSVDQIIIRDWGATQPNEIDAMLSNWPQVSPGDVIRELRRQRMWRVARVQDTEKRRVPMLQFMRLVEINTKDVEYKIPYDEEVTKRIIDEFEVARRRREF